MVKEKAKGLKITQQFLDERAALSMSHGYEKQKWIVFCEALLRNGYELSLYEARETVSKYITVKKGGRQFRVRFSNHKPNYQREKHEDCDFFVGRTNFRVTTTNDALMAVAKFFGK